MIYLLLDYLVEGEDCSEILKIGYSEKSFSESRENAYNTHNYGYKFLGEIEGTKDDEKRLHQKYKHLSLPGSNEWFKYDEDIMDEFFSSPDLEDLDSFIEKVSPITMKTLEKKYLDNIVDRDCLLGFIDSIYTRIYRSTEIVRNVWKVLLSGKYTVEEFEKLLETRERVSRIIMKAYEFEQDQEAQSIIAKKFLKCETEEDYVFVRVVDGKYDVVFDTGRQIIERLALEAYKNELKVKKDENNKTP